MDSGGLSGVVYRRLMDSDYRKRQGVQKIVPANLFDPKLSVFRADMKTPRACIQLMIDNDEAPPAYRRKYGSGLTVEDCVNEGMRIGQVTIAFLNEIGFTTPLPDESGHIECRNDDGTYTDFVNEIEDAVIVLSRTACLAE